MTNNKLINAYLASLYCESSGWDNLISETAITFGGKSYPPYGQVVIVSGGSGSGKGFIIDNLFNINGKRYDVDYLKMCVAKNTELVDKLSKEFNLNPDVFNLNSPEDVSIVHRVIKQSGLQQKYENMIFTMAKNAPETQKPNLIFDKTCKDFSDFYYVINTCKEHGYKSENIHFVWVLNDFQLALQQNSERKRKIDENLLISIHKSVAHTMKFILDLGEKISDYLNGDIWIAFNNRNKDTQVKLLNKGKYSSNENFYVENANIVKIKRANKPFTGLSPELRKEIISYLPEKSW